MAATNKKNGTNARAKARTHGPSAGQSSSHNHFLALQGNDGSPQTLKEFDESDPDPEELFFKPDENGDEASTMRCLILNYIHKELRVKIDRCVPYQKSNMKEVELYHTAEYMGVKLSVVVYFTSLTEGGKKECFCVVKVNSDDLEKEGAWEKTIWSAANASKDTKADTFSATVEDQYCFVWSPRWRYVVEQLRAVAYNDYDKYGIEIIHPEPEIAIAPIKGGRKGGATASGDEIEKEIQIFSGCMGKIIGAKGATINEIRAKSGAADIKLPEKREDGSRPKARELVTVILRGTADAVAKAEELVFEVQTEWTSAPRPNRDNNGGGYGGSYGGSGGAADSGYGGGNGATEPAFGGDSAAAGGDWATEVQDQADQADQDAAWNKPGETVAAGGWDGGAAAASGW